MYVQMSIMKVEMLNCKEKFSFLFSYPLIPFSYIILHGFKFYSNRIFPMLRLVSFIKLNQ